MKKYLSFIVALMVTLFSISSFAFEAPSKPDNGWYVLDQVGKLTADQRDQLNRKIENLNKTTKNEYAVVILATLDGADIADAAQETFRAWGVGKKDLNNGVMLMIATAEHKTRIQTGKGAEGDLPDLRCNDILAQQLKPHLKRGEFYEGIDLALDAMSSHMESRAPATSSSGSATQQSPGCSIVGTLVGGFAVVSILSLLAVFFVVRLVVRKVRARKRTLMDALDDEVTLPRIVPPVQVYKKLPVVAPAPVQVHVRIPRATSVVHPAPVVTPPRPATAVTLGGAAVGLGVVAAAGLGAVALAKAAEEKEEKERAARKRREREEEDERARKRRREEDSSSSSSSSSWDSGSSGFGGFDSGGSGFGGGDSGGGGASGDW